MLKDSEVHEISKMLKRLSKYGDRLWEMQAHTENTERDCVVLARSAIGNAYENLSWVVSNADDREYENYSPSRSKIWVDED